ncbi:MAG TPA: hypothetical protein VEB23_00310 [Ramlibacter sp.]|nr:hypothetical protein [Ramlibacter sp.]
MQASSPTRPASPIEVPKLDSAEPVAVIPVASAAPLDGAPDGERINTFTVAAKNGSPTRADHGVGSMERLRDGVIAKPLTYAAAAFSLGFILARVLR